MCQMIATSWKHKWTPYYWSNNRNLSRRSTWKRHLVNNQRHLDQRHLDQRPLHPGRNQTSSQFPTSPWLRSTKRQQTKMKTSLHCSNKKKRLRNQSKINQLLTVRLDKFLKHVAVMKKKKAMLPVKKANNYLYCLHSNNHLRIKRQQAKDSLSSVKKKLPEYEDFFEVNFNSYINKLT